MRDEQGNEQETDTRPLIKEPVSEQPAALETKAVEVVRHLSSGKEYVNTTITILSQELNTLIRYALSEDPRVIHNGSASLQRFTSPFEPIIQIWNGFLDLANPAGEGQWISRLRARLSRPRPLDLFETTLDDTLAHWSDGKDSAFSDLQLLMQVVENTPEVSSYLRFDRKAQMATKTVTFETLWTLFPPGEMVYATSALKSPQLFIVDHVDSTIMSGRRYESLSNRPDQWPLYCWYYDWDGFKFVRTRARCLIGRFSGTKPITSLPCYPLKYHKDSAALEKQLADRGKKFCRLCLGTPKLLDFAGESFVYGEAFEKTFRESAAQSVTERYFSTRLGRDSTKAPKRVQVGTFVIPTMFGYTSLLTGKLKGARSDRD